MKTLITTLVVLCCLFSDSSSLQCFIGNSSYLTGEICPYHRADFCVIYKYKSGTFDVCEEDVCSEHSCTNNYTCEESGTIEREVYGMKVTIDCCDKDLCNLESSAAKNLNKTNFCFFNFVLSCYILFYSFV